MEALGPRGLGLPGQGAGSLLSAEHPPTCPHEHIHLHPVRPHPCGGDPLLAQAQQLSGQLSVARAPAAYAPGWVVCPFSGTQSSLSPAGRDGRCSERSPCPVREVMGTSKVPGWGGLVPSPQLQVVGTQNYTSHVKDQVPACRPGKPGTQRPPAGHGGSEGPLDLDGLASARPTPKTSPRRPASYSWAPLSPLALMPCSSPGGQMGPVHQLSCLGGGGVGGAGILALFPYFLFPDQGRGVTCRSICLAFRGFSRLWLLW